MTPEPFDETPTPPTAPVRARKAGLETDSRDLPPIRHRPKRSPGRVPWRGILITFLPYLVLLAIALSGALALKGLNP